jgi:hypothetical protein
MEGPSGADVLVEGSYLAVAVRAVVVPLIVCCCSRGKRPHLRVIHLLLLDASWGCQRCMPQNLDGGLENGVTLIVIQ